MDIEDIVARPLESLHGRKIPNIKNMTNQVLRDHGYSYQARPDHIITRAMLSPTYTPESVNNADQQKLNQILVDMNSYLLEKSNSLRSSNKKNWDSSKKHA